MKLGNVILEGTESEENLRDINEGKKKDFNYTYDARLVEGQET